MALGSLRVGSGVTVPFNSGEIILLAALGGLLALDDRAGWQSLLAQPVFSAALVGWILGEERVGLATGAVLELVWLSILPMRGTQRPDAVIGGVVGAGTACLIARHTGDERVLFIASVGILVGLAAAEISGPIGRRAHRVRESRLGRFAAATGTDDTALAGKVFRYLLYSVAFTFALEALQVLVLLPIGTLAAKQFAAWGQAGAVMGAERWVVLLPAIGAGAIAHRYWQSQVSRYLVVSALIVLLLLWLK